MKGNQIIAIIIFLFGITFSISLIDSQIIQWISYVSGIKINEEFRVFGLQHLGIELIVLSGLVFLSTFIHDRNKLFLLALIVIIALFFSFLLKYAVNIPITDDYKTILHFSNHYFFTNDVSEKISLLTAFHGECRLVTTRIIIIILYFITGVVNIKSLIILANCCLPAILFLFYKSISLEKFRMGITLMIAVLFFQFGYYDAIVWATDALHYQFTILFLMLSLYLLKTNSGTSHVISILAALFAGLTFGNGLLVFPLAILFFVIKKNWKFVFIWTALGVAFILLYFQNFSLIHHDISAHSLIDYLIYSCCFIGGSFQFMYKLHAPFLIGLLIWILFIILTIKKYYKKNYFIYSLILFVILSSLIAAQFRLSMGLAESISNRYGIFSILGICASLIALMEITHEKKRKTFLSLSISLCIVYHLVCGIFFFPEVPLRKQKLKAFISDIKSNAPFKLIQPIIPEGSDNIVKEAIKKDIYFP